MEIWEKPEILLNKSQALENPFFMENQDYVLLHNSMEQTSRGGHNRKDYALTLYAYRWRREI